MSKRVERGPRIATLSSLLMTALLSLAGAEVALAQTYGAQPDQGQTDDPATDGVSYAGKVYYVDCNAGNDGNAGTSASAAWQSLKAVSNQVAYGTAPSGSAFLFKRGCTFNGNLSMVAKNYTFGAYGARSAARPILTYQGSGNGSGNTIFTNGGGQLAVRNLRLIGQPGNEVAVLWLNNTNGAVVANTQIENGAGDGITADHSANLTLQNCSILNNQTAGGRGGGFAGGGSNLKILNSTFIGNGRDPIGAHNIYVRDLTNALIEGNSITKGSNNGIVLHGTSNGVIIRKNDVFGNNNGMGLLPGYGGAESFSNLVVEKNIVRNNASQGMYIGSLFTSRINNNLIYGNKAGGIDIYPTDGEDPSVKGLNVMYNTFSANGYFGLKAGDGGTSGLVVNNNIFKGSGVLKAAGSASVDYNLYSGATGGDAHGVTGDPLFVAEAQGNFKLQSGSPAIKKGVAVSVTDDFDGAARTSPPSIGAYEYGGSGSSTPLPAPTGLKVISVQ